MLSFVKKEPVLTAAAVAAAVSAFFVRPSSAYLGYIDWSVLMLLFCLMTVVAGLMKTRLFDVISAGILKSSDSSRTVAMMLVNITFFSAMFITNDVALITLVPFTVGLYRGESRKNLIPLVVAETAAANLGSMVMPFGNPQNLYLYSYYDMSIGDFSAAVLPYGLVSLALVNILTFFITDRTRLTASENGEVKIENKKHFVIYSVLFLLCILAVLRAVSVYICFGAVVLVCLFADRKLFAGVDWLLLLTFCAFFIFVGNLGEIESIRSALSSVVEGHEFAAGVLSSQVISNVPAALMLSGFTGNSRDLLLGVDIGGLGTLVASLASVISLKQYSKSENADIRKYMIVFTAVNIILLVILCFTVWLFKQL